MASLSFVYIFIFIFLLQRNNNNYRLHVLRRGNSIKDSPRGCPADDVFALTELHQSSKTIIIFLSYVHGTRDMEITSLDIIHDSLGTLNFGEITIMLFNRVVFKEASLKAVHVRLALHFSRNFHPRNTETGPVNKIFYSVKLSKKIYQFKSL